MSLRSNPSTIYYNGHIHTFVSIDDVYTAVGVRNGIIEYVGNEPDMSKYDTAVDLKGNHVLPTLTDSHLHLLYSMVLAARSFMICEIKQERVVPDSLSGIRERIETYCDQHPKDPIIVANGYIVSAIKETRLPNRHELDTWTNGRAIVIYNLDGHSSALSTKMIQMLNQPVETTDGIYRGEAHEFMQGRVMDLIAKTLSLTTIRTGIANFVNECYSYGISRICALDGNEDVQNDVLTKVLAFIATKLPLDIAFFPQYMNFDKARSIFKRQGYKRIGGCSAWELDGSVSSQSAAFSIPYRNSDQCGHCYYSDEVIEQKVRQAHDENIQLTCHAIGELAIDQIMRAYEKCPPSREPGRPMNRIDHCEFPSAEAVEKLKTLNVALTVQPGFAYIDKRYLHGYEQYLSDEALAKIIPLRTLMDAGVCICGSTDSPVQSLDPYLQMKGMVDYYVPAQSLTPYQAYQTYSTNAANMLGTDARLLVGNQASFNVYSTDPTVQVADAKNLVKMIVRGKEVEKMRGTGVELTNMILRKAKPL